MERSLAVLSEDDPDEDLAALAAQVGRFRFFAGDTELAAQQIETALELAEALSLPEVLSEALDTKAVILVNLTGGMSHIDCLDLKPDAPTEVRGEFRPIDTAVPGIRVCEHLPLLAARMRH